MFTDNQYLGQSQRQGRKEKETWSRRREGERSKIFDASQFIEQRLELPSTLHQAKEKKSLGEFEYLSF